MRIIRCCTSLPPSMASGASCRMVDFARLNCYAQPLSGKISSWSSVKWAARPPWQQSKGMTSSMRCGAIQARFLPYPRASSCAKQWSTANNCTSSAGWLRIQNQAALNQTLPSTCALVWSVQQAIRLNATGSVMFCLQHHVDNAV